MKFWEKIIFEIFRYLFSIVDENMSASSSKIIHHNSDDDDESTESERLSPPNKRHCRTSNLSPSSSIDLPIDETKTACKSCQKQENLLKTFNCPSLHDFCLNCIFNWTQKHIQVNIRSNLFLFLY